MLLFKYFFILYKEYKLVKVITILNFSLIMIGLLLYIIFNNVILLSEAIFLIKASLMALVMLEMIIVNEKLTTRKLTKAHQFINNNNLNKGYQIINKLLKRRIIHRPYLYGNKLHLLFAMGKIEEFEKTIELMEYKGRSLREYIPLITLDRIILHFVFKDYNEGKKYFKYIKDKSLHTERLEFPYYIDYYLLITGVSCFYKDEYKDGEFFLQKLKTRKIKSNIQTIKFISSYFLIQIYSNLNETDKMNIEIEYAKKCNISDTYKELIMGWD